MFDKDRKAFLEGKSCTEGGRVQDREWPTGYKRAFEDELILSGEIATASVIEVHYRFCHDQGGEYTQYFFVVNGKKSKVGEMERTDWSPHFIRGLKTGLKDHFARVLAEHAQAERWAEDSQKWHSS